MMITLVNRLSKMVIQVVIGLCYLIDVRNCNSENKQRNKFNRLEVENPFKEHILLRTQIYAPARYRIDKPVATKKRILANYLLSLELFMNSNRHKQIKPFLTSARFLRERNCTVCQFPGTKASQQHRKVD